MRTSYGYDTYRGRTKLQTALTVLIVILLVVLLLAVAAFFLLQRYMVYTDDGQAHLELPFFQAEESQPPQGPAESQDIVIVTAQPTVEPTPTPPPSGLEPVALLRSALTDGTALEQMAGAGGDGLLFNMKAGDGSLGYVSGVQRAVSGNASAAEPGLNEAIQALTAGETYTIARVSCFQDNIAPRVDGSLSIRTNSGYKWRDEEDLRWMNPSIPAARQYVTELCGELAGLGFDEILLENSGWPTKGHLEYIKIGDAYDPESLPETVETFYQEVRSALEGTDVKLAVTVEAAALSGEGDRSGQNAQLLAQYTDKVYVLGAEGAGVCDEALAAGGFTGEVVYVDPEVGLAGAGKCVAWRE